MTNDLAQMLTDLEGLNVEALRDVWRQHWGEPPKLRAGDILRRLIAERLQEETYGIDRELAAELDKLTRRHRPGHKPKGIKPSYQQGVRLTREWQGVLHEVAVVPSGYLWNGEQYASLSKIAREITGVRWNGPRFFGLREAPTR